MKRYNITTCKIYQSQGQEKKSWPNVGSMVQFPASDGRPEGFKIELNMFPGTQFFVFDQKPQNAPPTGEYVEPAIDADTRERKPTTPRNAPKPPMKVGGADGIVYPEEEINPDDIPF